MGLLFVAILAVMLALFVVTLWSLSLRPAPREEREDPFVTAPTADGLVPRRVVVMSEDVDGVFRAS